MIVEALIGTATLFVAAVGVSFRAGRLRWLGTWYFAQDAPLVVRHLGFVPVPVALYGLLTAALIAAMTVPGPWPLLIVLIAVFGAVALLFAGVWVAANPPEWLKPHWLREAERSRRMRSLGDQLAAELVSARGKRPGRGPTPRRFTAAVAGWGRRVVGHGHNGHGRRRALRRSPGPRPAPRQDAGIAEPAPRQDADIAQPVTGDVAGSSLSGNGERRPAEDADRAARDAGWG
ncbi:MAG: hypothetical protein KY462_00700 [Actinobacteria bacterium]|nr:hypothetical protein [Actinomycetota bacterium]